MKKILAVVLALAFVVCTFAACGSNDEVETTTAALTEEFVVESTAAITEVMATETTVAASVDASTTASSEADASATAADESTTAANALPQTAEEILAAYTTVMNQAKKDAPGFTKVEYQVLPSDEASRVVTKGKTLIKIVLGVAENFMTTEADAKSDPEIKEKGNDMRSWPILKCSQGCMLTDTSAIQSAKCEELSNGNYKITITIKAEDNPEPCKEGATSSPSKTGAMFSPLSKAEIDDTLTNNTIVTTVCKDITYSLRYHDCTSVLVYNPKNNHVVSLDQTMKVAIKGSGKVTGLAFAIEKQELIDYMTINNIKY